MVEPHLVFHVQHAKCATAAQGRKCFIHLDVQHHARHQTPICGYTFGVSIYPSDHCTVPTNVSKVPPPRSMKVRAPSRQRPLHQHRSTLRDTGLHDIVPPEPQGKRDLLLHSTTKADWRAAEPATPHF
ncbi:hypothetical protein GE21DRAFT_1311931 [Neurospora crassa]|nr:hypothetical protein GE21DRAFT_1311931 [Neurospora crassa]